MSERSYHGTTPRSVPTKRRDKTAGALLVVVEEGHLASGARAEGVGGVHVPLDVVHAVRLVVVARQHHAADHTARDLVLETLDVALHNLVPAKHKTSHTVTISTGVIWWGTGGT